MRIHFIAIGGSAMHNLAIALHLKGDNISGSDDEIFEPSKGRLKKHGLLPENIGWDETRISANLDAIVLGMHAKADNTELLRAKELGLKIYSFPEYLYEQSKNKKRVVIGGSHGKTTITAIILHVLKYYDWDFDYMVGAKLDDFEVMVRITADAEVMVLEGDEYLTSALDRRPKFHLYQPDIALITGIAWDHINVFPTFENYVEQFRIFVDMIPEAGALVYFEKDSNLVQLVISSEKNFKRVPYSFPDYKLVNGQSVIKFSGKDFPVQIFGAHNMANLLGAMYICRELRISELDFLRAVGSFKGAAKRLELVDKNENTSIYKDFAHAPSKLKATVDAVREQYPEKELVACIELHTYSSLNKKFLSHYKGCLDGADIPVVYFNPHALKIKRLPEITIEDVKSEFGRSDLMVFNDSEMMVRFILSLGWKNKNLLMMSSGDFDGLNIKDLSNKILHIQ